MKTVNMTIQDTKNNYQVLKEQVENLTSASERNTDAIPLLKRMEYTYPYDSWAFERHAYFVLKSQRNYAEAAQIAEVGLKTNPTNVSLKRILAEALSHLRGEERRAEKFFEEMKEILKGRERIKLLSIYGDFLLRQGRIKKAQQIYNIILTEVPSDTRAWIDLARSYRLDEQFEECLRLLDEHPRPEDPFWLREKGHCLIEMGDGAQARTVLRRAKEVFYDSRRKGDFLRQIVPLEKAAQALNGQWQEAILWAIEQPQRGPVSAVWHSVRYRLISNNEVDAGIDYLIQVLTRDPTNLIVPYQIDRLIIKGNITQKRHFEVIDSLLQIAPQNLDVLTIAAHAYQESDPPFAEELWIKAWDLGYDAREHIGLPDAITWTAIGYSQFLRKQDRYDEAHSIVEQVRTHWGIERWELDLERAISLARLGSYDEAYHILEQLNLTRPDNQVVLDQMGACLRAMGKLETALNVYQRKVDRYPDDLFGWQGLGKTLFELGQHDRAMEVFEKILSRNSDDVDARWSIAQILQYRGEYDKAKISLEGIDPWALIERGWSPFFYEQKLAELERERLEQQAKLAEAKKLSYLGEMATATAHELNQPVGIIRAATDAALADLEEGYFRPEDMKPLLERILAQTDRLAAIIENFRKFARGDRTHREKVELNPLVERTVANFAEQFKHRNIELQIQLWKKEPLPVAWANPFLLEEVLINLLTNARDAVEGRENPKVWVTTWRRKGGGCGFSVEDNGPGLSPEYRKQMFVPFVSTKPTEKGTGLGLYISRRIIEDLGGYINYQDRQGGGACFRVNLPPLKG